MQLSILADLLQTEVKRADVEITRVTQQLKQVQPGSVFVAVRGKHIDGHCLVAQAMQKGAAICVVEALDPLAWRNDCWGVPDTRQALATLCAAMAGNPQKQLCLVGVTGTCGKTTVSALVRQLLDRSGERCGLVGTVENWDGQCATPAGWTTPIPEELYPLLGRMVQNGCSCGVLEASSQALAQGRLDGLPMKLGIFTNFGRDHLDDHGSPQAYFAAKRSLFDHCQMALLGSDTPVIEQLSHQLSIPVKTFGTNEYHSDFWAREIRYLPDGVGFICRYQGREQQVFYPQIGAFSVQNALAGIGAGVMLGLDFSKACRGVADYRPMPGRMERLAKRLPFQVYRDFAHTPESLRAALAAARTVTRGRLLVVFGCGGDRDAGKRPLMGAAAVQGADLVFLTSDNPRGEDPGQIMEQTRIGMLGATVPVVVLEDRREAIHTALVQARAGDTVLLAGKGHETTQTINGRHFWLDEKALVEEFEASYAYVGTQERDVDEDGRDDNF